MKITARLLCLLVCFPFCLLLFSCGQKPTAPSYQSYPFSVTAEVTVDGLPYTVEIVMAGAHRGTVRYLAPEILAGTAMTVTEEGIFLSYRDLTLPISVPKDADFMLLLSLFSLKEEDLSAASLGEKKKNLLTYQVEGGTVQLTVDHATGLPTELHASIFGHTVTVKILSFSRPGG